MRVTIDDIKTAARRIRGGAIETPLRRSTWLDAGGGAVLFKLEVVQPASSFKIRGAWNACARLAEQGGTKKRLVTASAGNHGQGLARAAHHFGFPLTVFVSSGAPRTKIEAMKRFGAELRLCADYDEAERQAKQAEHLESAIYISPYSHPDVIAGAGTIGLELHEQHGPLGAVVVPVGGGGLVSGIGIAMKALSPSTKVIGVEVAASCPFTRSLEAGRLVSIDVKPSLADGLTGNLDPDTMTLDIVREVVDDIVLVGEDDLRRALAGVVTREHVLIEGAAAAGVAAVLAGKIRTTGDAAVILSGANIDQSTLIDVLRG